MKKMGLTAFIFLLAGLAGHAVDFDTRACTSTNSEVFVSGMQRFVRMRNKSDSDVDKTRFNPTAVALGYQVERECWSAGLSVSYETGNLKYHVYDEGARAKIRDRTLGFTLFGKYRLSDGSYFKTSAFLGFARQKVKSGNIGPASLSSDGKTRSTRFGASIEYGKTILAGNGFRLTPHVGFDYSYLPNKNIHFLAAGVPERLSTSSQNFYEIPVGVTFAKDFVVGCDWVITPSVDATFVSSIGHMGHRSKNARPGFASRTGSEWKVYGIGASHWGGRITAGVRAVKSERFDVDVNYGYEGRKKYHDHRISATLGFKF